MEVKGRWEVGVRKGRVVRVTFNRNKESESLAGRIVFDEKKRRRRGSGRGR